MNHDVFAHSREVEEIPAAHGPETIAQSRWTRLKVVAGKSPVSGPVFSLFLPEKFPFWVEAEEDYRSQSVKRSPANVLIGCCGAVLIISLALLTLVKGHVFQTVHSAGFAWFALGVFIVPGLFLFQALDLSAKDIGLTQDRFGRSLIEAFGICLIVVPVLTIVLSDVRTLFPTDRVGTPVTALLATRYFFHAALQEIGARGLIQGQLKRILGDKTAHRAIWISSALFAFTHIAMGMLVAAMSFLVSLGLGYLYDRQKNLIGAIIVHFAIGLLAIHYVII